MPLSKNKFWYSQNCLHFSKCAVPLAHRVWMFVYYITIMSSIITKLLQQQSVNS